jgi:hypothetical protein
MPPLVKTTLHRIRRQETAQIRHEERAHHRI